MRPLALQSRARMRGIELVVAIGPPQADGQLDGERLASMSAIRAKIPFLDRDRALDGEVATAVRLVESGEILAAVRNR